MRVMRLRSLIHTLPVLLLASLPLLAEYQATSSGAPPSEVAPAIAAALQQDGAKITNNGKPYAEIWLRKQAPSDGKADELGVTMPGIPTGALLGVIRFDGQGSDRRGQQIKPGVYTLRYGLIPVNGDHQGAAPQRDFLVLAPAANDKDLAKNPPFEELVEMSKKASGTPHPAVMSFSKADADSKAGLAQVGDDWVLTAKLGDTAVSIIVVGTAAG